MDEDFLDDLPSYFTLAKNTLVYSNCRTRVAAVIAKKKPLIASANKMITHPKYVDGSDFRNSIHAEVMACLHLSDEQCNGSVIYVYREAKRTPYGLYYPALAKPCPYCRQILIEKNIKKVFYTIPEYPYYKWERL